VPPTENRTGHAVSEGQAVRCLFVTSHAHLPQRVGGSESTTHELCRALTRWGWQCAVLAGLADSRRRGRAARLVRRLVDWPLFADTLMSYPVYRRRHVVASVAPVVRRVKPAAAIVQAGTPIPIVERLLRLRVPTILYLHDVEFADLGGDLRAHERLALVANSTFTAARTREEFGLHSTVVPPLVSPHAYAVHSSRRSVVFVNPHPVKGADIAFALAERRRDISFVFVESWELAPEYARLCRARAAALPNVTWRERTLDMRSIYAEAKLVLVPSRWQEAWGRVVTEAQLSGIPVLASARGGLPEAVGPGGILVAPDAGLPEWARALSALWDDPAQYAEAARAALAHSRRPEIQPDTVVARFKETVLGHLARSAPLALPGTRQLARDAAIP
jgi:glycosyltransferase involved in cell wall biosynthesis